MRCTLCLKTVPSIKATSFKAKHATQFSALSTFSISALQLLHHMRFSWQISYIFSTGSVFSDSPYWIWWWIRDESLTAELCVCMRFTASHITPCYYVTRWRPRRCAFVKQTHRPWEYGAWLRSRAHLRGNFRIKGERVMRERAHPHCARTLVRSPARPSAASRNLIISLSTHFAVHYRG